ncbi:hypothetical protein ACH40E_33260 [Streptomyces acidicola]|uniref:hypothetical protein n=1 Tax=Streptomyces acidicola TaxID=2596892 RepID=UPI003788F681
MARAKPYSEGYLCGLCYRKMRETATLSSDRQSAAKSRSRRDLERAQRRKEQITAKTRAEWLAKRAAAQAAAQRDRPRIVQAKPEIKGKALKPPGPLADLPPMWWEFNG